MNIPGSKVYSFPGPIGPPPSGVTSAHVQATVTGAAGTLGSFLSGGVIPSGSPNPVFPSAVSLFLNSGGAVYVSMDGLTVPSATNGCPPIPSTPWLRIPAPHALKNDATAGIQLFCATSAVVNCFFEWD